MAKFCGKCGKPLQDGETCSCSLGSEQEQVISSEVSENEVKQEATVEANEQPAQTMSAQPIQGEQQAGVSGYMYGQSMQGQPMQGQPVQGQPMQGQPMQGQPMQGQPMQGQPMQGQPMQGQPVQGQPNSQPNQFGQQASQAAAVAGKYAKNIWQILLDIWKAPADNLKSFVNEKNFVNALILIGAEALLMVLFSCIILKKVYSMIMGIVGGISYYFYDEVKVPYLRTIFSTLIGTALGACIFAAITMLIVKQVGKANKSFKEAICITATKSAAFLPFLVVAIITSLFSLPLTIIVMALGGILGYFYVHTSLDDGSIQDGNKHVYTSFLIYAVYIIVSLLLMYLFSKL
ncbi:MAG TPA: hypothetical protein DCE48_17395 [Lachnospiraceae bacterium]|uniref:Yip1 family protein n=1 Tax=Anaerosporobacter sp. TaxID=1872529 RepID=UPI000EBEB13C|nr:hypothetical protein [Anaerosporobacter sp.]HAB62441.1 hypothetical protein [Lachnospiraceae bacterium]